MELGLLYEGVNRLRVFGDRVPRIPGHGRDEAAGGWRKFHSIITKSMEQSPF